MHGLPLLRKRERGHPFGGEILRSNPFGPVFAAAGAKPAAGLPFWLATPRQTSVGNSPL